MNGALQLPVAGFAADGFDEQEDQSSSVQSRDGKQVHHAKVSGKKHRDIQQVVEYGGGSGALAFFVGVADGGHHAHRAAHVFDAQMAGHQLLQAQENRTDLGFDLQQAVFQHAGKARPVVHTGDGQGAVHRLMFLRRDGRLIFQTVPQIDDGHRVAGQRIGRDVRIIFRCILKPFSVQPYDGIPHLEAGIGQRHILHQSGDGHAAGFAVHAQQIGRDRFGRVQKIHLFAVPVHRDAYRFPSHGMEVPVQDKIIPQVHLIAFIPGDPVTFLQACCRRGGAAFHFLHDRKGGTAHGHNDDGQQKSQDEVKDRSGCHYADPAPHRGCREGAGLGIVQILAQHGTGTAEGQKLEGVAGFAPHFAQQSRAHSERKFRHYYSIFLCQQKMS